jgi:hypothetical protein
MGVVPPQLLTDLRFELGLTRAVETGTLHGNGAATLAAIFPEVVTIELSPEFHAAAMRRFAENPRVKAVHGESGVELKRHVDRNVPTLYFLDAHWTGGESAGEEIDCPIRDELKALADGSPEDCILIDDAHLFEEPPAWRRAAAWPPMPELLQLIEAIRPGHYISVVNDQVVAVPPRGRAIVEAWERMANGGSRPLRAHLWRLRPSRVRWRLRRPLVSG